MQMSIKVKSFKDCDNLIGKKVSYYYGTSTPKNIRTGVVEGYDCHNRKVYFDIRDTDKDWLVSTNMHKLIEKVK